jgi:hypothetical protein
MQAQQMQNQNVSTAIGLAGASNAFPEVKPIEYFGRYNFPDARSAAEFIQKPEFTGFWDRNNAGINNIGIRAEINDSNRYNRPIPYETYGDALGRNKQAMKNNIARGMSVEEATSRFNSQNVNDRSVGRFYTKQGTPTSIKDTSFYLDPYNSTAEFNSVPVRVIADERVSRFSLQDKKPFAGRFVGENVNNQLSLNKQVDLSRSVGSSLGENLSSMPRSESFVSSQMAKPVSQGGESRVSGRVYGNGQVELIGKPKTPISTQRLQNAFGAIGEVMNYAGVIPLVTSEYRRAKSDYENPVTGETYNKDEVVDIEGQKFATADVQTIAMFHPDNAENHPEITDEMRKKFNPDWFKNDNK